MKRHRLRVIKAKAEELDVGRCGSLLCPRCKDKRALVPFHTFIGGVWFHVGDKCPECSYEFMLKDAPN